MIRLWATYLGGISDSRRQTFSLLERTYMKMLAGLEFCMLSLLFNIIYIAKNTLPHPSVWFQRGCLCRFDQSSLLCEWSPFFLSFFEANVTSKTCRTREEGENLLREMVCWVSVIRGRKHSLSSQALSLIWPWTHAFPFAESPCWCPSILGWGNHWGPLF